MSDFDEISSSPQWYIIHTYAGYENRVKSNLEKIIDNRGLKEKIMEIKVPTETVVTPSKKKDEADKVEEKVLFPAYVFIRMIMSDETWHVVRNVTGVTGFVGPGSRPEPISDEEIERLGLVVKASAPVFEVNKVVMITAGPLKGNTAIVNKISEDQKTLTVIVSMLGRDLPIEIDTESVEKVD